MSLGFNTPRKLRARNFTSLFVGFFLLLFWTAAAHALPSFRILFDGFDDGNGNGLIDCGEAFNLQVLLTDNASVVSPVVPVTGTITVPTDLFGVHWSFTPGTIVLDSTLTDNCTITSIIEGDLFGDDQAIFTYQCIPENNPGSHSYVLSVLFKGTYVGFTGPFQVVGEDRLDNGTVLTDTLTGSNVTSCLPVDLTLSKNDGGLSVLPGQTLAYVLSYGSLGGAATHCSLRETVPANATFNPGASSPGWSCASNTAGSLCTLNLGDLPAGAAGSRIFAVDVLATTTASSLANTATISTDSNDVFLANNTATDTTPINPGAPDLELVKSVSATGASPGSSVVFTLDLRNSGTGLTQTTVVHDSVPSGTTFDATLSSPGWSCSGADCSFDLGTFTAGATRSLAFAVRLPSPVPFHLTRLDNTACVTTSTPEPTGNNCGSASVPVEASPDLSIAKTLQSGQGVPGSTLVFSLTVRNSGNRDSGPVTLTETVPAFTTAVASPGWSCSPGPGAGSTCTALLPGIPGAGGMASRTFSVAVDNPLPQGADLVRNTACVTSPGTPQDCDTIEVPTDASAMVMLNKELTSGMPVPGTTIVYTITAQNTGNRASQPIELTETVPANTTFDAAASSPGWQCLSPAGLTSCTLFLGILNGGGDSMTRLFAVRVDNPLPAGAGEIRNTACAEEPGISHCDEVTVTPQASPVLAIRKRLASGTAAPGQVVAYDVAVSNTGNQHAASVVVTDALPLLTAFEPAGSDGWSCKAGRCTLTLPALSAGTTTNLRLAVRVAPTLPAGAASLLNRACATDGPLRTVCDSVEIPLEGSSDLSLEKAYNGPPLSPGIDLPFTLILTNAGLRDAAGVRLLETIPAASTFQPTGSDPRWSCTSPASGSTCELTLDVAAQSSASVAFVLRSASPLPAGVRQIANAACLLLADGNAASCDEVSTPLPTYVEATLADALADDSNGNGTLEDGETLRYTLVVTNPSTLPAANLTASTALDPHLALRTGSVSTSGGQVVSGNAAGDTVPSVEIPYLAPGASVTIEFEALAVDASAARLQEVASQATVSGPDVEAEPSDDPDTPELDDDPTRTPIGQGASGVHEVPTLSQLGLLGLALLLASAGLAAVRRRRT